MNPSVAISGASGLVGQALMPMLASQGWEVTALRRGQDWAWDPSPGWVKPESIANKHAVIHLAGKNIADQRWTPQVREAIMQSRWQGTRVMAQALVDLPASQRPGVLICASASGYYGDRKDELLDETSPPGQGFLPRICTGWEQAADPARQAGIRVIHVRLGIVLAGAGGPLAKMLPIYRLGLGGVLGDGKQYWSWITLHDALRAIHHCITCDHLSGPVNLASPDPVTNRAFVHELGHVLRRPTLFPAPAWALRLILGDMANDLLLASLRVWPDKLLKTGFEFDDATLRIALKKLL